MRIKKNVEIISLIYQSVNYLKFVISEFNKDYCKNVEGWDVGFRIVANDATEAVLNYLKTADIPFTVYNDPEPNSYYLNRVYRAYNHAVKTSTFDNVILTNSDIIYSSNWIENLLKHHDGVNIPCCRLVESGKMLSGQHGITHNFGQTLPELQFEQWYKYVEIMRNNKVMNNGLYMPLVIEKERFIEAGGYPEGNIYNDGVGTLNGDVIRTADEYFFHEILEKKFNMKHVTIFDSLVYHIQEGEKDVIPKVLPKKVQQNLHVNKITNNNKYATGHNLVSLFHGSFIKELVIGTGCQHYLELGVYDGECINNIVSHIQKAVGVDIKKHNKVSPLVSFYEMKTDKFFEQYNGENFDIIFIDAAHDYDSVKKDFHNSLKLLNKYGLILLHDTSPCFSHLVDASYCGDAYKFYEELKTDNKFNVINLPLTQAGLMIVQKIDELRHNDI